jgi:hypothetical protein
MKAAVYIEYMRDWCCSQITSERIDLHLRSGDVNATHMSGESDCEHMLPPSTRTLECAKFCKLYSISRVRNGQVRLTLCQSSCRKVVSMYN